MDQSILFNLPPELLCGLCNRLPGEELRMFGATCRRLKEIADQTAVGRIAYLLRKRDPMWARLHKGAVRQGLRSASAILAFMETNLHRAKTKTRLPTVVKLSTGNNYHSLEQVDDLKKVDLFEDKKVELDFKIGNDIAAAAFFTSLPTLALYQWDLIGSPQQAKQSDIWIRRPNRNILVDLSMYDIFDNGPENVILGTLQVSSSFIALYLPCMDIILIFDINNTNGGIEIQVIELDFDFEAFLAYYVVHDRHYFVMEEVSDELNSSVFVRDQNNNLQLYTRIDAQAFSLAKVHEDMFMTTLTDSGTEFHLVKLDRDDPFERSIKLDPLIKDKTSQCQFTLETVCGQVLAICKCSGHVISFDLTSWRNTNANCMLDMDTHLPTPPLPSKGIDYVIHFANPADNFFHRMGSWFRVWYSRNAWRWSPNVDVKLPSDLDGNISIFSTFIHSRSNCALIYDYFPVTEDNSAMSINLFF